MKINVETEEAEAGYVIMLDPGAETASEGAEYFYLNSGDVPLAGNNQNTLSADFVLPREIETSLGKNSNPAILKTTPSSDNRGPQATGRAQYEGFHIAHYQVERAIGRGGMGDVYLAKDTRLGRPVAIKLLRADYQPTEERVRRIELEARAVCALNHPNIVTIYEIGEVEGAPFIVSEFIEGDTLRQMLPPAGMRPEQALEITIQIANALASAHQVGIIHRDIKPENVMVRSDGYVKVLDFGLAKLSDALEDRSATRGGAPPDVVLGTVSYMSPEQARGEKVDARSDVFSLGILLYELLAGKKPFDGRTTNDVLTAILKKNPLPIPAYTGEKLAGIQYILGRALRKNRDERYASMPEMIRDLRTLKDEIALVQLQNRRTNSLSSSHPGVEVLPINNSGKTSTPLGTRDTRSKNNARKRLPRTQKSLLQSARSQVTGIAKLVSRATRLTSVAQNGWQIFESRGTIVAPPRRRSKKYSLNNLMPLISISLVLAMAAVIGLVYFKGRSHGPAAWRFNKFTADSQIQQTAISPDGKFIAFSGTESDGREGLWLRQTANGALITVIPAREVSYRGMTFSENGESLFFLVKQKKTPFKTVLYRMSIDGGPLKTTPVNAEPGFDLAADAKAISYLRTMPSGEKALMIADLGTGKERQVAVRKAPNAFASEETAWSEDGEEIACAEFRTEAGGPQYKALVAISLKDGSARSLSLKKWASIGRIISLHDDRGWMVVGSETTDQPDQLWQIDGDGHATRVSNDRNGFSGLSITRDGRMMATTEVREPMEIWVAPANDLAAAHQVTRGGSRYYGPSWAPDGTIVTDSGHQGAGGLWKISGDGSKAIKITGGDQKNVRPVLSPDGRYLIVQSIRNGRMNLWSSRLGDNTTVQLTHGENDVRPHLSPDGAWVFYESLTAGRWGIWKVQVQGGKPELVLGDSGSHFSSPNISQDGKWMALRQSDPQLNQSRIVVVPASGGKPAHTFDLPATAGASIQWAYGGQGLTYVDERSGAPEIWFQPISGGAPRQLTRFGGDRIFSFAWSPDGKKLLVTRGKRNSTAMLLSQAM